MTVNTLLKDLVWFSQLVVTLYEPGVAFALTVTVAVAELPPMDRNLVVGKALELMVLPATVQAEPLAVSTSWPPGAMTLGAAVTLDGWSQAEAAGAASPTVAAVAAATTKARVVRM